MALGKIETDSQNRTVTLPTVGKANLSSAGQTAAPVPFSIRLKDCNADDAIKLICYLKVEQ